MIELRIPTERSREVAARLGELLPGGDTRTATWYPPYPLAIARGEGYRIVDHDGNAFIDLLNNFTALIHGHAHPAIVEAVREQAARGTVFPAPGQGQAQLASLIASRFESVELLRFTNSGTEATMMCVQAARAFTGRDEVVKIEGGYHGSWLGLPMLWAEGGGTPRGMSAGMRGELHMVPYNDPDALEATLERRRGKVAAVIIEPVMGEGVIPASAGYLARARELADAHGCLLVFDEVISARLGHGGRQGEVGVRPDLTAFGKMIGGGLPVGAFGGRREVMEIFDPSRPGAVGHSGTFNGNAMTTVAGTKALELYDEQEVRRLNALGASLAEAVSAGLEEGGLRGVVTRCGSLVNVHLDVEASAPEEITQFADLNLESPRLAAFHLACLDEGLFTATRGLMAVSTPMDEAVIEEVRDAVARAAHRVATACAPI